MLLHLTKYFEGSADCWGQSLRKELSDLWYFVSFLLPGLPKQEHELKFLHFQQEQLPTFHAASVTMKKNCMHANTLSALVTNIKCHPAALVVTASLLRCHLAQGVTPCNGKMKTNNNAAAHQHK